VARIVAATLGFAPRAARPLDTAGDGWEIGPFRLDFEPILGTAHLSAPAGMLSLMAAAVAADLNGEGGGA
jgi:hypothetical protein